MPGENVAASAVFSMRNPILKEFSAMKNNTKKITLAGILCAVAVVGSLFSFPVLGSKCAPVQHIVNILCAVFLGPWYGVCVAFVTSILRNLLGLGSLMAFPGSMCGAALCGIVYVKSRNLIATLVGEVFGTGIIGGLLAYPVATLFMNVDAAAIAFYVYIVPFLISTVGGSVLAGILVLALKKTGALNIMRTSMEK
jgi:energy coupling factor transporter S component ThiW